MRLRFSLAFVAAAAAVPATARADVQHVVAKGHTVEAIANRYRVSAKSIIEANHLKDVKRLRVGDVLTIPKVDPPPGAKAKPGEAKKDDKGAKTARVAKATPKAPDPPKYATKPKTPGVVHLKRTGTTEELDVRLADKSGKVAASTLKAFEKAMRSPSGLSHPIEARLISLLGVVSNHFGSRKIEIISGFRPYVPTQYTAHSHHNHGKAVDFRVVGVPNEVVRDFCRTLKNVGCGYYPNSTFVHMDVREKDAFWIDYSKPGEPPRYNAPNLDPDEGTSDVHDAQKGLNAPPPAAEATDDESAPTAKEHGDDAPADKPEPLPADGD